MIPGEYVLADTPVTATAINSWFSEVRSSVGATSVLTNGGCLIRYYTDSVHWFNEATSAFSAMARRAVLGLPPLDLRKG